jgi:hypothetical protein
MKREGVPAQDIDRYFYVRGRDNPFEDKIPLRIHIIKPASPLGGGAGGLNFDPAEMKGMLAAGELQAQKFVAALIPGEVDWA